MKDELTTETTTEHIQELQTTGDPTAPRVTVLNSENKIPCLHCGHRNSNPFENSELQPSGDTTKVKRCGSSTCRREIRYTVTREEGDVKGERGYRVSAILEPKPNRAKVPRKLPRSR